MRPRTLLVALLAVASLLALAPAAGATILFSRFTTTQWVWVANDDGTNQRRLAEGNASFISPDGSTAFYLTSDDRQQLRAIPTAGGPPRTLARSVVYGPATISPDGTKVAITTGPLNGAQTLRLIDVASGASTAVAKGYFYGASFSPDSTQLAYGRAAKQDFEAPNDVYAVPVAGGAPRNVTSDGHSAYPVWGPTQIAFSRWKLHYGPKHADSGPAYNITVIDPDGSGRRDVTNMKIPYLMSGLISTDWSADGTKLLTQFTGQDTTYAVGVDVASGRTHVIGPKTEFGFGGTALTADGATVLGTLGPPEEPGNVVTMPWDATRAAQATTLLRRAFSPTWTVP